MQFLTALLLTLTPAAVLAAPASNEQAQPRSVLPDGFYITEILANGTLVHTSVNNPRALPIVEEASTLAARAVSAEAPGGNKLSRRRTDCWGRNLDHAGVDRAVQKWKNYLAQYTTVNLSTDGSQRYFQFIDSAMTVYYCVNRKNSYGSLSLDDFNYALRQMDQKCRAYEASFFQWDGSVEIVGKATLNDRVCIGDS
ncbi:hypothetical protein QBC39DRAFT_431891 [Podospora conica]|nr:hypothetical protein QBC39DRAFT_431891 [Schizothecium conicum]